jgi:hypothetical protein
VRLTLDAAAGCRARPVRNYTGRPLRAGDAEGQTSLTVRRRPDRTIVHQPRDRDRHHDGGKHDRSRRTNVDEDSIDQRRERELAADRRLVSIDVPTDRRPARFLTHLGDGARAASTALATRSVVILAAPLR